MPEITFPQSASLTQTLKKLNKAFILLNTSDAKTKKDFLESFYKAFAEIKTEQEIKDAEKQAPTGKKQTIDPQKSKARKENEVKIETLWAIIGKIADKYTRVDDVVDPTNVLGTHALPPYIGDMTDGVMFCDGMTIGLVLQLAKGVSMSYRLDFAPDKLLHINFEIIRKIDHREEKYPICIKLKFSTGRFGFTAADRADCALHPERELAFLEAMKFKFWLKMTIARTLMAMPPNLGNDELAENKQLLAFVRGEANYDLNSVKRYIRKQLPEKASKLRITASQTEQELLACIKQTPALRAACRDSIFITLSDMDQTKRMLQYHHHLQDLKPHPADSDQRIDSEQPLPAPSVGGFKF